VLALVAEGRTNRQIGQALYITPKTAGVHVSRILAKLGVAGRRSQRGGRGRPPARPPQTMRPLGLGFDSSPPRSLTLVLRIVSSCVVTGCG
jgi:hypothetical protein